MRCPTITQLPPPPPEKKGWPWTEESRQLPDTMPDGRRWPRVSVVTPSYNQGLFIEETIRSVLLQGYPDLEYIIMDGGSTDGTLEILRKYEPWLAHWVSQPDQGQTNAINQGWARATGEILAYINSDDCYQNGAISAAVAAFSVNPKAGIVYGSAIIVDEAGLALRVWEGRPFNLKAMLTEGNIIPQPTAFFSASALHSEGYLDEQWHMIMDYDICIRIGMRFPTVCLPETLARFRDHPQSKTRTRFEKMAAELIQMLNSLFPEGVSGEELQAIKRTTASRIHYEWAMTYLAHGRQHGPEALKQLLESFNQDPIFVMKRPLDTGYIVKEALLNRLSTLRSERYKLPKKS